MRVRMRACVRAHIYLCVVYAHIRFQDAEEEWPGRAEVPHVFEVLHEPVDY